MYEYTMRIVFATQNKGKLHEAADILGKGVELLTPQDCEIEGEAEETGTTFAENSFLKAKYIWDRVFGNMAVCWTEYDALYGSDHRNF